MKIARMVRLFFIFFILSGLQANASEADDFVSSHSALFKTIVMDMGKSNLIVGSKFVLGDCQPPEQKDLDRDISRYENFERAALSTISQKFRGGDPDSVYVRATVNDTMKAWRKLRSSLQLSSAGAALESNCIDSADRLFRNVIDLDASPSDFKKAQIGIDDVRERRRRISDKERDKAKEKERESSGFMGRWWSGK